MGKIKKILKLIWSEFVYGGHITSVEAVSVVFAGAILLNMKITWDFIVIIYSGTYLVYLYNRYKEFGIDILTNPDRTKHFKKYTKITPLIIILGSLVLIGIPLYLNKMVGLFFIILLFFLGLFYSAYLKRFTKKLIGFKSFYIAFIWTLLIVLLVFYYSFPVTMSLFLVLIFVYLRYFIGTIFFDIKDIESDKREGLLTLAVLFGKKKIIRFLNFLNILSGIPIVLGFVLRLLPGYSLILLFVIPYAFNYFKKSKDMKIDISYLTYIATPLEKILWTMFLLLGKFLL